MKSNLYLLFSLPLLFLALFYFYPLWRILRVSFSADSPGSESAWLMLLFEPFLWRVLWFTIWQAAASTALTLVLGLPFAYIFAGFDFRGKVFMRALTAVPFVMPTIVVATAFTALLGRSGPLNQWLMAQLGLVEAPIQLLQTQWMILIAHAFFNVTVVIRTVGGFWANLNPRLNEAAAVLGASPGRVWREITFPLLLPSILAAGLLVFLFCFTSFGVVLILGGLRFATLEVEIYRQAVSLFNLPVAALLALVQMAITFAVMNAYTRLQARTAVTLELRPLASTLRKPRTVRDYCLVYGSLFILSLLLLVPLLTLARQSLLWGEGGQTFRFYHELTINRQQSAFFVAPIVAIRNSVIFALSTTVLSLLLGIISAYILIRPRTPWISILDPILLLPLGTSAVTLGFGYIVAMGRLRSSLLLIPIAHTLIAMPFVIRTFLPALRRVDSRLRESAAVMGATPLQVWWQIDVPLLFRALLVSATFAFTISLGEFGASLLISRPDMPTMPILIFRALGQPGELSYGQAMAMSTIMMAVSATAIIVIERFRIGEVGEF